ncbi:hypothetical protein ACQJBY_056955 [Aegilops geniculata]
MGLRRRRTYRPKPTTPWMTMPVRWCDLPDDLLPLIYVKVASLLDRVRFAAVCRSWRAAATASRHAAPPVHPWLIFSSHGGKSRRAYCPEEGGILRIRIRRQVLTGKRLVGAHDGGSVALIGDELRLVIVNLFSGTEVSFPARNSNPIYNILKVVFSESPTSTSCILAAIMTQYGVAVCQIGRPNGTWTVQQLDGLLCLMDIVFHNGHLYGITCFEQLVKFKIGVNKDGVLSFIAEPHQLQIRKCSGPPGYPRYIIELHGKLVMVARSYARRINYEPVFKVFELAEKATTEYTHQWEELMSLGDYALLLGAKSSKAVHVPASGHDGVQRSCIYADDMTYLTRLDGHGDCVCPVQDKSSHHARHMIKLAGSYVAVGADTSGMWVFPPNFWAANSRQARHL